MKNRGAPAPAKPSDSTQTTTPPRPPQLDLSNQLQDAEAAYNMIVKNAAKWSIDTNRIGMIGFSAGAGLTMHCTLNSKIMKLAFIGPIYGGMGPVTVLQCLTLLPLMIFFSGVSLVLLIPGSKRAFQLSFIFIKMADMVSAWVIRIEPVIIGSMHLYTGWMLTAFLRSPN
jgi:predicted peptidase